MSTSLPKMNLVACSFTLEIPRGEVSEVRKYRMKVLQGSKSGLPIDIDLNLVLIKLGRLLQFLPPRTAITRLKTILKASNGTECGEWTIGLKLITKVKPKNRIFRQSLGKH